MQLGFIGLGHMGNPMATNLLKSGHQLLVFDVQTAAADSLCNKGAGKASSIAELAKKCDIIISSVQTGQQVTQICLGPEGVFANAKPDALYIDCSSIEISTTKMLHEQAGTLKIAIVDAPVSGGVAAAQAGSLTIMVGGTKHAFDRALPILQSMGKKVIHAGPAGHGQAAKICNNMLLAISMIGVAEAFSLAKKLGLDQKKFFEISSNASGQCWSMTQYCPAPGILENVPSNRDYKPGFMAKMMLKDLRLAQHAAEGACASIPLGAMAAELYELYVTHGYAEKDFSGIYEFIHSHADDFV